MTDILMCAPMMPIVLEALDARFTLHKLWEQPDPQAYLADVGPRIRGLAASTLAGPVGAELLDKLPGLEIVSSFGVGYDHIDAKDAAARGIMVTNTPGVLDEEVADLTLGLLLATVRRIPHADRYLRAGKWEQGPFPLSPTLRRRTVGILGLGNIGKAIARRLEGFGVAIGYHGRHRQSDVAYTYYDSLLVMAEACDVLIAIVPGGAATRHIVNADVLKALGPNGILINVARGSVIDEAALIVALNEGHILAAGLDVFDQEPHVPHALIDHPATVLLPHVASATQVTRDEMGQLVVDNLIGWFDRGDVLTPVPECAHLTAY